MFVSLDLYRLLYAEVNQNCRTVVGINSGSFVLCIYRQKADHHRIAVSIYVFSYLFPTNILLDHTSVHISDVYLCSD